MENSAVARVLDEVASLLEMDGANWFRVRAYRNAARIIRDMGEPLGTLLEEGPESLTRFEGIGKDLATRIESIATTGDCDIHRELLAKYPEGILDLLRIPGMGPKKIRLLYDELGIASREDLEEAIENESILALPGFGKKSAEKLLRSLRKVSKSERRVLLSQAEESVEPLLNHLRARSTSDRIEAAGSFRRRKETIGDLDVVLATDSPEAAAQHALSYPEISEIKARGDTKISLVLKSGLQVDMRIVSPQEYGAALLYFTGSQAHNIELRKIALAHRLKLNEYGVFEQSKCIARDTEEEIYRTLGLRWIPPELREGRNEINLAAQDAIPPLVELDQIKGDLHSHTTDTDGRATLEEMAGAAIARGYSYLAITDHSRRVTMARGLDEKRLLDQWSSIDRFNESQAPGFRILKGIEVDILEDGTLDIPESTLAQADYVVASLHYGASEDPKVNTRRLVSAARSRSVDAIGHPTGRILNKREPYPLHVEELIDACAGEGCLLELNGSPSRMDLSDSVAIAAADKGVKFVCSTDSHAVAHLNYMRYAIDIARRAGLTAAQIVNTSDWPQLKRQLPRHN